MVGVLALSGLRVTSVDGGFALTFGDQPKQEETLANTGTPTRSTNPVAADPGGVQLTPVSTGGQQAVPQYNRDELLYMVGAMMEERDRRRDQELAGILQAMYQDVGARQDRDYQDLRDQINRMNVGMYLDRRDRLSSEEGVQSLDIQPGQPVNGQKEN